MDLDGYVGIFSSAGSGIVPPFYEPLEDHVDTLLAQQGFSFRTGVEDRAKHLEWFAYDGDFNGGPYRRVVVPRQPTRLEQLPEELHGLAARTVVNGRFAELRTITDDQWGHPEPAADPAAPS